MDSNVNITKNKQFITQEIIEKYFNLGSDLISKLGGSRSISTDVLHLRMYSWGFNIIDTIQRFDFDFVYDQEQVHFYENYNLPLDREAHLLSIEIMRKFQKLGFPEKEHFKPFSSPIPPKIIITPISKGDNTIFDIHTSEIHDKQWVLNIDNLVI